MSFLGVLGAIGGALSGFGSLFSAGASMASSAMNYAATNEGMKKQYNYNTKLQKQTYGYNKNLQQQSFGYNQKLQSQSYNLSKQLQQFQNDYTTMMSNSAHQREVADLKAAGLNPILSANNGASTPSAGGAIVGAGSVGAGSVGSSSVGLPSYSPGSDALDAYLAIKHQSNENRSTDSTIGLQEATAWRERKQASVLGEQARNEAERYDSIIAERNWTNQQIKNSIAVTAAQIDNLKKQGDAAIMNAIGNYSYNSAAAANAKLNNSLLKRDVDFYNSDYGRAVYGVGQTFGALGKLFSGNGSVGFGFKK